MAVKNNKFPVSEFLRWQHSTVPFLIPASLSEKISAEVEKSKKNETSKSNENPEKVSENNEKFSNIPKKNIIKSKNEKNFRPDTLPNDLCELEKITVSCQGCPLCEKRRKIVFGEGSQEAEIMFIGEGPGAEEDRQGRPFVGKAGTMLTAIIEKGMRLERKDVYISNIVKCRPPGNRDPFPKEAETCLPYLKKQIELISPSVIILLGKVATKYLTGFEGSLKKARTMDFSFKGIPMIATYHPSALLRNKKFKRPTWEDMKKVIRHLNLFEI